MAVRYLAALGHRRFCYVGRTDPLTGKEWGFDARARGYKDEIVSLGLTDCGIHFIDSESPRSAKQVIATMLAQPERPTAICVWSDYYALRVVHELQAIGVRIPEDVSVFGFDGSDVAESIGLSTMVPTPPREIGQIAARKALNLVEGEDLGRPSYDCTCGGRARRDQWASAGIGDMGKAPLGGKPKELGWSCTTSQRLA